MITPSTLLPPRNTPNRPLEEINALCVMTRHGVMHVVSKVMKEMESNACLTKEKKEFFCKTLPLLIIHHSSTLAQLLNCQLNAIYNCPEYETFPEWKRYMQSQAEQDPQVDKSVVDKETTASMCGFCELTATWLTNGIFEIVVTTWERSKMEDKDALWKNEASTCLDSAFIEMLSPFCEHFMSSLKDELLHPKGSYFYACKLTFKTMPEIYPWFGT